MQKYKTEPLKTLEVDIENGIFRVNGKQIDFCTGFELVGYIGKEGPSISLTTNTESFYAHKMGIDEFSEMGKPHCPGR